MENTNSCTGTSNKNNEQNYKPPSNKKKIKFIFTQEVVESFRELENEIKLLKPPSIEKSEDSLESLGINFEIDENLNIINVEAFRKNQNQQKDDPKKNEASKESSEKKDIDPITESSKKNDVDPIKESDATNEATVNTETDANNVEVQTQSHHANEMMDKAIIK